LDIGSHGIFHYSGCSRFALSRQGEGELGATASLSGEFSMLTTATRAHRGRWRLIYLKDWRMARLLTQEELAQKAGVSRPTLSRAEHGEFIYGASVRRIAEALRLKPEDLLEAPRSMNGLSHPL